MIYQRNNILIFTEWFYPGFRAGGPISSIVNMVDSISEANFFIVTGNRDLNSKSPYEDIPTGKWIEYNDHTKVMYLDDASINNQSITGILSQIPFDICYLNSLFSPYFTLVPLWYCSRKGHKERVILAPRGMLKPGALSVKSGKKKLFLKLVSMLKIFNRIGWHASSEIEAEEVRWHFGDLSNVYVVPNIARMQSEAFEPVKKESGELRLVTVARISPEKGMSEAVRFLDQPALENMRIHWTWIGPVGDTDYFDECLGRLKRMDHVHFDFKGECNPRQVPDMIREAHCFYLATRGENYGHAIAEALSMGKPVIISDRTPWRNLRNERAGYDLPLDDISFLEALLEMVEMGQVEYSKWSTFSRSFVLRQVDNDNGIVGTKKMFGID